MSLNCLLWRGGGMVDTKDFEKLSLSFYKDRGKEHSEGNN